LFSKAIINDFYTANVCTYIIYNLSEFEFAWWDLGGDNLTLGGDRAEKDSGGGNGVGTGTTAVGTGWGWG